MKVRIQRLDLDLPLPTYATAGSVGFDLLARLSVTIPPHALALIPANLIVEVPEGYMLVLASRSSTPKKKGLLTPHGLGIIDRDYCGPQDELKIQVYNFTEEEVVVERGEKIAQGLFVRVDEFEWEEQGSEALGSPAGLGFRAVDRGGFGSTDAVKL